MWLMAVGSQVANILLHKYRGKSWHHTDLSGRQRDDFTKRTFPRSPIRVRATAGQAVILYENALTKLSSFNFSLTMLLRQHFCC